MVRELNDSRLDRIFAVVLVFKVCYIDILPALKDGDSFDVL